VDALLNRERAMEIMDRESIDGLIARLPVNSYYLSNYWGLYNTVAGDDGAYWAVLPRDPQAPAALVLPATEVPRLETEKEAGRGTWVPGICAYSDGQDLPDAFQALARALHDAGLESVRLATDDARTAGWLAGCGIDNATFSCRPQLFNEIRLVKSSAEIELMKHAAHVNEMALLLAADSMAAGADPDELENLFMMTLAQQGGRGAHLFCGAAESPLGTVSADALVGLSAVGTYQHYHAAFGRCAVVGEPDKAQRKAHAHMLAGWEKAREMLQPGVSYAELSRAVGEAVRAAGLTGFRNPRVHSIGLEYSDDPTPFGTLPQMQTDQVLQPDMMVTVDMSHTETGEDSLRIEDTARITTYGHERLSKSGFSIRLSGDNP